MNKTFTKYFGAYIIFVFIAGFFGVEYATIGLFSAFLVYFYFDAIKEVFRK